MLEIAFDDIDALRAQVSDEPGPFGAGLTVTQEMINAFADLSGDRQWIHVDVERARAESPYGGPIAHGFLTLSLLPRLRPQASFKIVGYGGATNYGCDGLRFLAPVPAGSTLQARSRTIGVEQRKGSTLVKTETTVHVVDRERASLLYKGLVLYHPPREPGG